MKPAKTCGSCIYFDHEIRQGEKKLHKDIGHKEYGKPCTFYEPNPYPVAEAVDDLRVLANLINKMPNAKIENLAHTILGAKMLRTYGYRFMQRVIVQWRGSDDSNYINNFLVAFIAGISKDGNELRLISYNGEAGISKPASRVFTLDQWREMHRDMKERNRIIDPKYKHTDIPSGDFPDEAPASIRSIEHVIGDMDDKINRFEGKIKNTIRDLYSNRWKEDIALGNKKSKSSHDSSEPRSRRIVSKFLLAGSELHASATESKANKSVVKKGKVNGKVKVKIKSNKSKPSKAIEIRAKSSDFQDI